MQALGLVKIQIKKYVKCLVGLLIGSFGALPFAPFELQSTAWLIPALWFHAAYYLGSSHPFGALIWGWLVGCGYWGTSLYWLLFNPFPAGAIAGWVGLTCYLACYIAMFCWLSSSLLHWICVANNKPVADKITGLRQWAGPLLLTSWPKRQLWYLLATSIWVGLEMARSHLFGGFPWNLLAVSLTQNLALIQYAAWTGPYGLSWLICWVSLSLGGTVWLSLAFAGELVRGRRYLASLHDGAMALVKEAGAQILLCILLAIEGRLLVPNQDKPLSVVRVAAVQPSIPQRVIFEPGEKLTRFQRLYELTELALAQSPQLVLWPEASLPNLEPEQYERLFALIRAHQVWFVFGATDVVEIKEGKGINRRVYNAAILVGPDGQVYAVYHKRHLVPFGEFIPLESILPIMRKLTPLEHSLDPGKMPVWFPIQIAGHTLRAGVLICFEDIFPYLARQHAPAGAHLLINITNDGWFGNSAAQWQHAYNAAWRAVENRIPLVRCGNNGLSCWVDAAGRIHEVAFNKRKTEYEPMIKVFEVPIYDRTKLPFYSTYGDVFGLACAIITLISCLLLLGKWVFKKDPSMHVPPQLGNAQARH